MSTVYPRLRSLAKRPLLLAPVTILIVGLLALGLWAAAFRGEDGSPAPSPTAVAGTPSAPGEAVREPARSPTATATRGTPTPTGTPTATRGTPTATRTPAGRPTASPTPAPGSG